MTADANGRCPDCGGVGEERCMECAGTSWGTSGHARMPCDVTWLDEEPQPRVAGHILTTDELCPYDVRDPRYPAWVAEHTKPMGS